MTLQVPSPGIVANLLIAGVKVVLGLLTSSVAIVSEGVNNAGDVLTSVLTMVGTKLAASVDELAGYINKSMRW